MTVGGFKRDDVPALVNDEVDVGRRLPDREDPNGVGISLILSEFVSNFKIEFERKIHFEIKKFKFLFERLKLEKCRLPDLFKINSQILVKNGYHLQNLNCLGSEWNNFLHNESPKIVYIFYIEFSKTLITSK